MLAIGLPLLFFVLSRLLGAWDVPAWLMNWYYRGLFHYYAVYVVSLMALVASLFTAAALGAEAETRSFFITLAFGTLAMFLILGGIALPGVFVPENAGPAFTWSARFSLFGSAVFFGLSNVQWKPDAEAILLKRRRLIWTALLSLGLLYCVLILGFPDALLLRGQYTPYLFGATAALTIGLLLWASWGSWLRFKQQQLPIDRRLALTMILLAEAQVFLVVGSQDGVTWWLYQVASVAALGVALWAIVNAFEKTRDLRPARYFFALGSVLILGLSLISGELGWRWFHSEDSRWITVGLSLLEGGIAFLVMYLVVLRLDRLITDRTLALQREQRMRDEMTQMIVHDLKNPLTVIGGSIEMLKEGAIGPVSEEQKRALSLVQRSGRNVLRMVEDMLDLDRLEAGVLKIHADSLEMTGLLDEVVAELQDMAERNQQNLVLSRPPSLPLITGDRELLQRVLYNLIAFALRFTPEGGDVVIDAVPDASGIAIRIADGGPTLSPEERATLFGRSGRKRGAERRGRGMGLAFCKSVVEAHGGLIEVESGAVKGTEFQLRLPMRQ